MNIRTVYAIVLLLFCLSIPVAVYDEKIIFLVKGYDRALVFEKQDTYESEAMVDNYYAAYMHERGLIMLVAWLSMTCWLLMFITSLVAIKKRATLPFKLPVFTAVVSFVLLLVTVGPILVFGHGWPPRPF